MKKKHFSTHRKIFGRCSVAIICLAFCCNIFAQNADIELLRKINVDRNTHLDGSFRLITNAASPICVAAPVSMLAIGLIKHDKETINKGLVAGSSVLLSVTVSTVLKYSIMRQRPFWTYPDIQKETAGGGYSFPSGHTTMAFSTATAMSLAYPKWYVVAPGYVLAGLVGYSRMHLGVHYPSDVLFGAIIGTGSAFLSYKVQGWIKK